MSCWKGAHATPIPAAKLAIPGVFCLATKSDGTFDWEAFISGFKGTGDDSCCEYPVVQYIDLLKVSPPSQKCPIFGGYKVYQTGTPKNVKGIRTWWPLAYTMPGTTFTLTLKGMCQDGNKKKPYKEVYKWTVVANPDTFDLLIDLFHTNSLGELEVPSIVGEDTYAALKKCAAKLKQAVDAFIRETQRTVTGEVKVKLFKGQFQAVARRSPVSLYDFKLATYNPEDAFDHHAAEGFIKLWGLPTKVYAQVHRGSAAGVEGAASAGAPVAPGAEKAGETVR
ncbi:MAG: argininosuccinate synthase [Kyrpidia sp.]|nr:argininosuccinate synthase [Kyrpidia sp.]